MIRGNNRWPVLVLILIIGGIIGAWLGDFLTYLLPGIGFLGKYEMAGIQPFTVDLRVFTLTLGCSMQISFFSIVGWLSAVWIYRRL